MTSDLMDRLSKLEGPDWGVSCEIISSLISVDDPDAKDFYGSGKDFTASVDAAIALAERVLPGWHWSIYDTDGLGRCNAQMERPDFTGAEDFDGIGATPAIALCIALLRAKEASKT